MRDNYVTLVTRLRSRDWSRPVSYTHLDVYKRQTYHSPATEERIKYVSIWNRKCYWSIQKKSAWSYKMITSTYKHIYNISVNKVRYIIKKIRSNEILSYYYYYETHSSHQTRTHRNSEIILFFYFLIPDSLREKRPTLSLKMWN